MEAAEIRLRLDEEQRRSLLAQLNEAERGRPSRNSRIYFRSLQVAAYALPAALFLVFLLQGLSRAADRGALELPRGLHLFLDRRAANLNGLAAPLVVAVAVLLLLNVPLIAQTWRRLRLARALGALALADHLLTPERAPAGWRRLTYLFCLPPFVFLLAFLGSLFRPAVERSWPAALAAILLLVFLPWLLALLERFFARLDLRLRQFEEIAALKGKVETWDGEGAGRSGLAGRLALFERSHLLAAAAEQVAGGLPEPAGAKFPEPPGEAWVAELAPEARRALEILVPEKQAEVSQLLRELCDQPERGISLGAAGREDGKGAAEAPDLRWYSPEHKKDFVLVYALRPRLRRIHLLQLRILAVPSRQIHIFFSYSHEDTEWFARLREELAPLETFDIHFWTDTAIAPGESWFEAIGKNIAGAHGAFLLVSGNYLQSDFIRRYELPLFLERAETSPADFVLLWFPLAPVDGLGDDELGRRILTKQALGDPKKPLMGLPAQSRAAALRRLRDLIHRTVYQRFQRGRS